MLNALRALLLIGMLAVVAACNPAASPSPTLSLESPAGGLETPAASMGPESTAPLESTGTNLETPLTSP